MRVRKMELIVETKESSKSNRTALTKFVLDLWKMQSELSVRERKKVNDDVIRNTNPWEGFGRDHRCWSLSLLL